MRHAHLKLVVAAIVKRTLTPKRAKNRDLRSREYLTEHEIEALMVAVLRRTAMDIAMRP